MLIGLYSAIEFGLAVFGTGQMRLIFQSDGKVEDSIQQFIICISGDARYSETGLINFAGMLSYPVEQSDRSFSIHFTTSSCVT